MEPENASSGRTDPAARAEAVLMKFLRVDVIINDYFEKTAS